MAGGVQRRRKLKAVIPGGSSVPVVPGDVMMHTDMDYDSIAKAGSMLGSGAVIVIAEGTCMVKVLANLAHFYAHESCGQCTPCREGTGWLSRVLHRILQGKGGRRTSTCWTTSPGASAAGPSAPRRCRGDAGAELPEALPARVRIPDRARQAAGRERTSKQKTEIGDEDRRAPEPGRGFPSSAGDQAGVLKTHRPPQLTLPGRWREQLKPARRARERKRITWRRRSASRSTVALRGGARAR
jgi:hypothetical protein